MSALLTPTDVAKRWHMDVKTLSNWRVKGKGPTYLKLGEGRNNKVLYREEDIAAYELKHIKEKS
jgi:hypothetical protein